MKSNSNQPPRIFDNAAEFHSETTTSISKNFVANVFSWMVVGLVVTSIVAWYGAYTGLYANLMLSGGIMPWVLMLSPFAFIIAMNAGLEKFSATTLTMMFLAFSACMGLSSKLSIPCIRTWFCIPSICNYSGNFHCNGYRWLYNFY